MRRGPSFSRSRRRTRQERLRRTLLIGAAGILLLGVGFRACGGDDPEARVETVAFSGSTSSEGVPSAPDETRAEAEGLEIRELLDDWYQRAFADPTLYGDGTFPLVAELFVAEAGVGFVEDRNSLTIGELASQVRQVTLGEQTANLTVFFQDSSPLYATADVRFVATVETTEGSFLELAQKVRLVFEKREGQWKVTNYYGAERSVDSIPEPTPTS
ncbi:MAG: hypothetical protein ACLGH3_05565 [Actinomycetota bacterium]